MLRAADVGRYQKTMESTGNIDKPIECKLCGGEFTVRQLILAVNECYGNLNVVRSPAPCCQATEELWLRNGLASRGYIYAAGQAHFADMEQYDAPGLVAEYDVNRVLICLGDFEKSIPRK